MREIDTDFGEWIEDNYRQLGLTQRQFAEKIGVSYKTVSAWQNQGTRPRDEDTYDAIAAVLGIDANEVRRRAGRREISLQGTAAIGAEGRAHITVQSHGRSTTRAIVTTGQPFEIRFIPIVGTAAADTLRASWGHGDLYPVLRSEVQGMGQPVMMVVSGDCMEPRINDGDLVILDAAATPALGDVLAVRVGDDVTLKEYWEDDGEEIVLRAIKAGYAPIRIRKEDQGAQLVGVVKRWIRTGRV